jgi:CMP/dCMP kinase
MAIVTISRQFGAGGHTLGIRVAERLGYQLVDKEIIAQVAKEANVSVEWVQAVEKEAGGLLMRLVNGLVDSDFIERLTGETSSDFDEKKYFIFLKKVVFEAAEEGDVVFVGRGSQFILPDDPETVKILLVAEKEDRHRFIEKHYRLSTSKAEQWVAKEEKRRVNFLKQLDPRHPDDPGIYDLMINTSKTTLTEAEEMIVQLVGLIMDEFARPIWE